MYKIVALLIGGALVLVGGQVWANTKKFIDTTQRILTETIVTKKRWGLKALTLVISLKIKNPGQSVIRLTKPFIQLFYEGESISSSELPEADDKTDSEGIIEIEPRTQLVINDITFLIPYENMKGLANDFADNISVWVTGGKSEKKVVITAKIYTIIKTDLKDISNDTQEEIVL